MTRRPTPAAASSGPPPSSPARRFGAPRDASVPRMEHVRVTAPDLLRRAALDKTRSRLVIAAGGFALLFAGVVVKLADATVIQPVKPRVAEIERRPEPPKPDGTPATPAPTPHIHAQRANITDRNGQVLALSLATAGLYANPREMIDLNETTERLKKVLPRLDVETVRAKLGSGKQFIYLARQITPAEQVAINALGIPGIYFEPTERRRYPLGRAAAQVLGEVDVDGKGVGGVERAFDTRLREDSSPLRLSIDVRVQAVVHDELLSAMTQFSAIAACGIVMDVNTGEVIAMVSLPDYDNNEAGKADEDARHNRGVNAMYEPGSTFKLQTAGMALDSGAAQIWSIFDASAPIHIGRFTITDFEGKHRPLYLPEVLAYSSNLGAARMAMAVGTERQRAWLGRMGMFSRIGIELPEAGLPIVPPASNWKDVATMTVGFGHGIAVSPLHVVRGTAALANGGIVLRPTILALPPDVKPQGERIMQQSTSDTVRKLMRLVVTAGYGKPAEVPGYYVGGKTGTAEKVGAHGYKKHTNVSAFMSVFPMNAPRYAVYMMLDEPKATSATHGYSTAGYVSAPAAGKVIARIGPMLGLLPQLDNVAAIEASIAIPLEPGRGSVPMARATPKPLVRPAQTQQPAAPAVPAARDIRHEASFVAPAVTGR